MTETETAAEIVREIAAQEHTLAVACAHAESDSERAKLRAAAVGRHAVLRAWLGEVVAAGDLARQAARLARRLPVEVA